MIKRDKWCQHGSENGKCEHCYEEQSLPALEIMDCGNAVGRTLEVLPCNPDPSAPHGFDRNGSHNAGRYVCECKGWEPDAVIPVSVEFQALMAGALA